MKHTSEKLIEDAFELLTDCKKFIPTRKQSDEDLMEDLESWQQRVYEYWDAVRESKSHKPTLGDCLDDEGNEVYNIPDEPDLAQEFEELYNKEFNQSNAAKAFINLHERLKRLEKGTE